LDTQNVPQTFISSAAHQVRGDNGTCGGDSGAGVLLPDSYDLLALVQRGDPLCRSISTSVRVGVPHWVDWLVDIFATIALNGTLDDVQHIRSPVYNDYLGNKLVKSTSVKPVKTKSTSAGAKTVLNSNTIQVAEVHTIEDVVTMLWWGFAIVIILLLIGVVLLLVRMYYRSEPRVKRS
jgi:hypothetical protein